MISFDIASCGISIPPFLAHISLYHNLVFVHNIIDSGDGDGCGYIGDGVDYYKYVTILLMNPLNLKCLTTLVSVVLTEIFVYCDPIESVESNGARLNGYILLPYVYPDLPVKVCTVPEWWHLIGPHSW